MTGEAGGAVERLGRWERVGLALIVVVTVLPAVLAYPFPSQDGPLHEASAFIFSRIDDATLGFAPYLERNVPLSGQAWALLLAGLDQVVPFPIAQRIALALLLALFPLAGILYARASGKKALPIALALALAAHSWVLVMGFWSFMLGMALAPLAAAMARRLARSRRAWPGVMGLTVLLLGLAWVHAFAAVFAGIVAVLGMGGAILEARRVPEQAAKGRSALVNLGLVGLAGVPALAYVVGVSRTFASDGLGTPGGVSYEPILDRIADIFSMGPGGISTVTGVVFAGGALLCALCAFRAHTTSWTERLMAIAGGVLIVGFLAVPLRAANWAYLSPRLLFAAMIALAMAAPAVPDRRGVFAAAMIAALAALGFSAASLVSTSAKLAPIAKRLESLRRAPGSPFVPLPLSAGGVGAAPRHANPLLHLGVRASFAGGGVSPYLFAINPAVHPIRFRARRAKLGPPPPLYAYLAFRCSKRMVPDDCIRRRLHYADRLSLAALRWGELILLHPFPGLSARLRERGFQLIEESDDVAHLRARSAWLEIEARAFARPPRVWVQLLPDRKWHPLGSQAAKRRSDEAWRIGPMPAGALRVRFAAKYPPGEPGPQPSDNWTSAPLTLRPRSVQRLRVTAPSKAPP